MKILFNKDAYDNEYGLHFIYIDLILVFSLLISSFFND